jgi:hypothetical protein
MLFSLPSFISFFVAAGWGTIPLCPVASPNVNAASMPPAQPALPPWMEEQGWFSHSAGLERPGGGGLPDPLLPAAGQPLGATLMQPADQASDPSLRIPLAGTVFVFGQAEKDTLLSSQTAHYIGQTGVSWKMPVQAGVEFLFSCGPELTYIDLLRPDRPQDRSALPFQTRLLRLDVQCRWRLLGQLGLECQGSVCPALNPGEQDAFRHDLHLALPLCHGGEFHLGAKYYWERTTDIKPGPDSGQLYGDFRLIW